MRHQYAHLRQRRTERDASGIAAKATASKLEIGLSPTIPGSFDGRIDELRIYDEQLTEAQIKSDRDEPIGSDPGLSGYDGDAYDGGHAERVGDNIGGIDNSIGGYGIPVHNGINGVGVAPGARLWDVKVRTLASLDCSPILEPNPPSMNLTLTS